MPLRALYGIEEYVFVFVFVGLFEEDDDPATSS